MNLYQQAAELTQKPKLVEIRQGSYVDDPATGEAEFFPTVDGGMFSAEIVPLTSNQASSIDRIMDAETPPAIIARTPNTRAGGMEETITGYDYENPDFKNRRIALIPRRDAMTALYGCPQLYEDTPGDKIEDKVKSVLEKLPGSLISGIAMMVRDYSFNIEEKGSEVFTDGDSPASPSSSDSPNESPADETKKSSNASPE